jgi:hypothetical protein
MNPARLSSDVTQEVRLMCAGAYSHAGQDGAMSYQLCQLGWCDWCLSHASLFDVTQFCEYLASLFLFLPPHFCSTFSLHLAAVSLVILTSSLKSYPVVF